MRRQQRMGYENNCVENYLTTDDCGGVKVRSLKDTFGEAPDVAHDDMVRTSRADVY